MNAQERVLQILILFIIVIDYCVITYFGWGFFFIVNVIELFFKARVLKINSCYDKEFIFGFVSGLIIVMSFFFLL